MKHLTKFVKYIVEAKGIISDDDFEALTIPFKHMGVTYRISDEQIATVDEFKGRKYKNIHFSINFKVNNGNLKITKDKIDLDFEIKEVPQIIKNISIVLK